MNKIPYEILTKVPRLAESRGIFIYCPWAGGKYGSISKIFYRSYLYAEWQLLAKLYSNQKKKLKFHGF